MKVKSLSKRIIISALAALAATQAAAQGIDIEASAQELTLHVGGMVACKLDGVLPMDAVNKYAAILEKLDTQAFMVGAQKATLIIKSLPLRPGSQECNVVKEQLAQAAEVYAKIAKTLGD